MRIIHLTAMLLAIAFATPQAFACHPFHPDREIPSIFWSEAPTASQLHSGEVAVRVAFKRWATSADPALQDFGGDLVTVNCGRTREQQLRGLVFEVIDVLGGEGPEHITVLVQQGTLDIDLNRPELILVGSLTPLRENNAFSAEVAATWRRLEYRMPPRNS